jgi:hypothetical protein
MTLLTYIGLKVGHLTVGYALNALGLKCIELIPTLTNKSKFSRSIATFASSMIIFSGYIIGICGFTGQHYIGPILALSGIAINVGNNRLLK